MAPERRSPTKTKVATLHRYEIMVGGLDGQDRTAAYRGALLPDKTRHCVLRGLRGGNRPCLAGAA